jgi:hypothetical protein
MWTADAVAKEVKDKVNDLLLNRTINRPTLIEGLEDAFEDIRSALESLRDDEARSR